MATTGLKILSPEKHLWEDQELIKVCFVNKNCHPLAGGVMLEGSVGVSSYGLCCIQRCQLLLMMTSLPT